LETAAAALTLASSPSFAQEPLKVACESIELYDSVGGDFQKAIKAVIGTDKCRIVFDIPPPEANLVHVDKSEGGNLCVRQTTATDTHWPHCYWIDGRKLRYIGHGPQLSDEQFAEVERLLATRQAGVLDQVMKIIGR
jgi:hypothetical protein